MAAAVEEEIVSVEAADRVQRARPVVAVRATVVLAINVAATRSGKEYRVTIRTSNLITIHSVLGSPTP